MTDLADGEVAHVQGSAKDPYEMKNVGGVYSCTCPAWRNQGGPIDRRSCKHLKGLRGEEAEIARVGDAAKGGKPLKPATPKGAGGDDEGEAAGEGAPPVLLAHRWENDIALEGWWMSEKLDGVRAWWDGKRFLSRLGNAFIAPGWFTAGLPDHPLDGELWVARQEFQKTVSIVRRADAGEQWRDVKYLIFDAPAVEGAFETRVAYIEKQFGAGQHEFAKAHTHVVCTGLAHLREELARVESLGGEGLMLRQPGSKYVSGRSTTLLKVKTFHDAEGRVIAHEGGKGKHKGRLGALVVEMPDGTRFNVGTGFTDKEREAPPPIGAIITYRYQELTKDGVPRFPSYVGVALDKDAPTMPTVPKPTAAPTVAAAQVKAAPTPAASPPAAPVAPVAPAVPSVEDGEAVRAIVKALATALRIRRFDDAGPLLDEHCVFLRPDGARIEGRSACIQEARDRLSNSRVLRGTETDHRVDLWGSVAVVTFRWEMTIAAAGKAVRDKGIDAYTLAKQDGTWRVVWRALPPLPAPAPVVAAADSGEGDAEDSDEGDAADDSDDGDEGDADD